MLKSNSQISFYLAVLLNILKLFYEWSIYTVSTNNYIFWNDIDFQNE